MNYNDHNEPTRKTEKTDQPIYLSYLLNPRLLHPGPPSAPSAPPPPPGDSVAHGVAGGAEALSRAEKVAEFVLKALSLGEGVRLFVGLGFLFLNMFGDFWESDFQVFVV